MAKRGVRFDEAWPDEDMMGDDDRRGPPPPPKRVKAELPRDEDEEDDGTSRSRGGFWGAVQREHPELEDVFNDSDLENRDDDEHSGLAALQRAMQAPLGAGNYAVLEKNDQENKFEKTISYKPDSNQELKILAGETLDVDAAEEGRLKQARMTEPGAEAPRSAALFGRPEHRHPVVRKHQCVLCEYAMSMSAESANAMKLVIMNDLKYVGMTADLHLFQALANVFNIFHQHLHKQGGRAVYVATWEMAQHMLKHATHNPLRPLYRMVRHNEDILEKGAEFLFGRTADDERHWNSAKTKLWLQVQGQQRALLTQIQQLRARLVPIIDELEAQLSRANVSAEKYSLVGGHVEKYNPRNIT